MKAKYCHGIHPFNSYFKNGNSPTWRRLCAIGRDAENNIQWGVSKGLIFLWQDNWPGISSISKLLNTQAISTVKV